MNLKAALQLVRPVNCLMIGFAVVVGEFVSGPAGITVLQTALGFLTGALICAFSMVVNDVYDIEVDRVNQPGRPIPSGRVSIQEANRVALLLLLAGIACSVLSLSPLAVAIASAYALLSWAYSYTAKKRGLEGNLIVASSLAIPFIYGGVIANGSVVGALLLLMSLTAFFSGVGREVVKAMADVQGDSERMVNSVARERGMGVAAGMGGLFFMLAVVTSWAPFALGLANELYTFGVVIPDVIFLYLTASILRDSSEANAHRVKTVALVGMLAGLLAFVGGGL